MSEPTRARIASFMLRFLLRYLGETTFVLGIIAVIGLAAFSYRALYKTFTDAQAIAVLRTQVAVEDFDLTRFERIRGILDARRSAPPITATTIRDPFAFPAPTTPNSRQPSR